MIFESLYIRWQSFISEACKLWNTPSIYTRAEATILATILLLMNLVSFVVQWYLQYDGVLEYGFPKRGRKYIKKRISQYSLFQRILIFPLVKTTEKKGFFLYLCLAGFYCVTVPAFVICIFGFIGALYTGGAELTLTILFEAGIDSLLITAAIRYVPDLIWLPSEQRRYGIKPKKR